ncbi:MAG: hypothetical protein ACXVYY_01010 [Oryzihumus sp.]
MTTTKRRPEGRPPAETAHAAWRRYEAANLNAQEDYQLRMGQLRRKGRPFRNEPS